MPLRHFFELHGWHYIAITVSNGSVSRSVHIVKATPALAVTSIAVIKMPPKSRKRKSPGATSRTTKAKQEVAPLESLPDDVHQKVQRILTDWNSKKDGKTLEKQAKSLCKNLERELELAHVDRASVLQALSDDTTTTLEQLISDAYRQTQRAHRVFELLDTAGKGLVVMEDLQSACQRLGQELDADELEEMINQYAEDGLLTKDDFVKIARQVGL
jgi:hypothetical protein